MQHDFIMETWTVILVHIPGVIELLRRHTLDQSYDTEYAKIYPEPENTVHEIISPTSPSPQPFNLLLNLCPYARPRPQAATKSEMIHLISP
jgi:hypothetical protein